MRQDLLCSILIPVGWALEGAQRIQHWSRVCSNQLGDQKGWLDPSP